MIEGRLIKMWYEYDRKTGLELHLVIRTTEGIKVKKKVPSPIRPYFFIAEEYLDEATPLIYNFCKNANFSRLNNCVDVRNKEIKLVKVEVDNPKDVGEIRRKLHNKCRISSCGKSFNNAEELVKHVIQEHEMDWDEYENNYLIKIYEADIPFVRRVRIDLGIMSSVRIDADKIEPSDVYIPPKLLFFDVESDDRTKKIDMEKNRIISIAANDKFFCYDNEARTLFEFQEYARDFDFLIAHNSDKFDYPYLKARCKINNVPFILDDYCVFLDIRELWQISHSRNEPSSLEYLARTILKEERIDVPNFWDAFENNRELLKRRNMQCVSLIQRINEKFQLVEGRIELADYVGIDASNTYYPSVIAETAAMRKAIKHNPRIIFPCRIKERPAKKYKGALVLKPIKGLHQNVLVYDFKRLYPRIIRTFNIGIDTLDENGEIKSQTASFTLNHKSLFAEIIEEVEKSRSYYEKLREQSKPGSEEYKKYDLLQGTRKILLEVIYGVNGDPTSRFYNKNVAESITYFARFLLQKTVDFLKNLELGELKCRCNVIYGDTDSVFVKLEPSPHREQLLEYARRLERIMNIYYCNMLKTLNIPKDRWLIEIKLEAIYDTLLLADVKKRRFGHLIWKKGQTIDDVETAGFELIRGDWSPLAKEFQENLFNILVKEKRGIDDIIAYAKKIKEELYSGKIPLDKLIISKGLSKTLDEYKSNQPHIRAAKKLIQMGYDLPDKIEFIVTSNLGDELRVEPIIRGRKCKISGLGIDYYWRQQLLPILNRILGYIGYKEFELERGCKIGQISNIVAKQTSLFDYGQQKSTTNLDADCNRRDNSAKED